MSLGVKGLKRTIFEMKFVETNISRQIFTHANFKVSVTIQISDEGVTIVTLRKGIS